MVRAKIAIGPRASNASDEPSRPEGCRMLVSAAGGFTLLHVATGARKYASCAQVIAVLRSAVVTDDQGPLTALARARALEIELIAARMAAGKLPECQAARKLCGTCGTRLEEAVYAAVAASSGALARARGTNQGLLDGARQRVRRGSVGARARRPSLQLALPAPDGVRRHELCAAASAGQPRAGGDVCVRSARFHCGSSRGDVTLRRSRPRERRADEAALQAFERLDVVGRAHAVLARLARREEAAMVIQVTWRIRQTGCSCRASGRLAALSDRS